jgi:hypothetical protein
MFFIPGAISRLLTYASESLLILSLFLSLAYSCGWIHRLMWHLAEAELRKALNGTPVTIGSLRMDLMRGRLWASNVVIHSPRREQWKWESPVLARVGRVYVETNLVLCLLSLWFLGEEQPLDVYTIHVSDIQVFVERKHNFFNFFLLDPRVELPDPQLLEDPSSDEEEDHLGDQEDDDESQNGEQVRDSPGAKLRDASTLENLSSMDMTDDSSQLPAEEKAQKLMDDMLRALSRATKEGFTLQGALVEHRQEITSQLKALQTTTKKSAAMQEGVKIVQHVSKVVVEKTQTVQQVVLPTRREPLAHEKTVFVRIGRILIRDLRIFTRDYSKTTRTPRKKSLSSWNKPILVDRVSVRSSELCPPLSAKDENDLPALYQPIEKCIDVAWKRVLVEASKSNTGRLFKTAMGEVLDYWMEKDPAGSNESY